MNISSIRLSPGKSLQKQLLLIFSVTLGLALLGSVLGVGRIVEHVEQHAWQDRQQEAALRAAEIVDNFIKRQIHVLRLVDLFGLDELNQFDAQKMAELVAYSPDMLEIILLGSEGQIVSYGPKDNAQLAHLFTIPQSNWFIQARLGRVYIGDVQRASDGSSYIVISIPVRQHGVLAARLRMEVIQKVVQNLHFGVAGSSFIADREGAIIAHSDHSITDRGMRLNDHPELFALLRASSASWAGEYVNLQGVRVVGTTIPVADSNWMIITEAPQSEAYAASRSSWQTLAAGAIFVAFALALSLSVYMNRNFLAPVKFLLAGVRHIKEGNLDHRIAMRQGNEIGQVAVAFNEMTERLQDRERDVREQTAALLEAKSLLEERVRERTRELEEQVRAKENALAELAQAQSSLLEMSRAAGMAEVATGVLHNVGNVLNSVNVSCNMILDQLRESRVSNVSRVAALLTEAEGEMCRFMSEDARGLQLPAYLSALAQALQEEHEHLRTEAESLHGRIDHIKEIVTMQQTYGRVMGVTETLPPQQLMEDALQLNIEALGRHNISIVRDYAPVPDVTVDRHKVLQILLNLINNAKYACTHENLEEKTITLRISNPAPGLVRMEVSDKGIGIEPANLKRIFQHGFTTRRDGHGFGLHSGALAARDLGGSLGAHSDGPGHGATFTLDLPCTPGGVA
jgi:signal transduction histidine kinase